MFKKEYVEKYNIPSIEEEYSRWMLVDIFVLDGLAMAMVFSLLVLASTFVMATIATIVTGCVIGALYLAKKYKLKMKYLENINFIDMTVYLKDGPMPSQYAIEKYERLSEDNLILVNDDFVLDTSVLFPEECDIDKSIFSFTDGPVLTKYGLGNAPTVNMDVTYEGEYYLDEKAIPILMIRFTEPLGMELSK